MKLGLGTWDKLYVVALIFSQNVAQTQSCEERLDILVATHRSLTYETEISGDFILLARVWWHEPGETMASELPIGELFKEKFFIEGNEVKEMIS